MDNWKRRSGKKLFKKKNYWKRKVGEVTLTVALEPWRSLAWTIWHHQQCHHLTMNKITWNVNNNNLILVFERFHDIVFVRICTGVAIERSQVKGPCSNNVPTCRANVCAKPLQGKDWQRMKVCWLIWVFMGFQGNCHVHVVSKTLIMHLFLLYYTEFFTTANKLEAEILIKVLQECCI